MDTLVLIVAVLIVAAMVGLYLRWLRRWWFRLAALVSWVLFLGSGIGASAARYGLGGVDSNVWVAGVFLGLAGGLAVHVLNNRYVMRLMQKEQADAEGRDA